MNYATTQDMIDRFGQDELVQLTDRSGAGVIDQVVLGRALADADADIDSYLGSRYTLPLPSVPSVLVRVGADIARYYLYGERINDLVKTRYDAAITFLQQVAKGLATLEDVAANQVVSESGGVQFVAGRRVFSRDSLQDY